MSKDVYEKGHYQQTDRDKPLPLRWMSLESLREGIYTSQSDVVWLNVNDLLNFLHVSYVLFNVIPSHLATVVLLNPGLVEIMSYVHEESFVQWVFDLIRIDHMQVLLILSEWMHYPSSSPLTYIPLLQWSYGILLWELVTRGSVPYPGLANSEVKELLESGRRLDKPTYVDDIV